MATLRKSIGALVCVAVFGFAAAHLAFAGNGSSGQQRVKLKLIGQHDLGGGGWNTDVCAHGDYAYVGTWGLFGYDCLDGAVKVISLKNPSNPVLVGTIPAPAATQTNDVKVAHIRTKSFRGDVLAISNEDCADGGARGVELWDVSDPTDPVRLSRIGPAVTDGSLAELLEFGYGVHNTFMWQKNGRAYLGCVVDGAEIFQFLVGVPVADMSGDVRIYDITDPSDPVAIGDWGTVKNLGQDPFDGQGEDSVLRITHDIWVEKGIAYISYWDAGLVLLDVSDPADPVLLSQTQYAADQEGNTHVAVPAQGGNLVITGDEDFTPGPWGFLRVFDTKDPTDPVEIGSFATVNALLDPPAETGDFSMHNVIVRGSRLYISWYGDGVRIVDISNPRAPREIGSWVPAGVADPQGFFPTASNIWGIAVHRDLILASDTNAGLYVLKQVK